jgi:hypothetical protein
MRLLAALILLAHGIAHLPGFLASWRLATLDELPHRTTVLANSVNVGEWGIRAVGVLWLAAALAFAACGMGAFGGASWWLPVSVMAAAASVDLCILGWPDSRIGAFVNVGIAVFLLAARQTGSLP